jgi:predicted site-specific integrase-resolvase
MKLCSVKEISEKHGIKIHTLRDWIKSGKVAGIPKKPFLVDEQDLLKYLLKNANERFKELYSKNGSILASCVEREK